MPPVPSPAELEGDVPAVFESMEQTTASEGTGGTTAAALSAPAALTALQA